ncbi:MAG: hypothetical protein A3B30_00520 [Candidatus Komeilibacteria bacterium RIFCSPLOWO2_01_FULL_52_15]|uniref:Uncharacterized protein n=1 Tax=Candidatus Komeilibacteria bacterium RIFCSPLOWO2_01_FULL_52_15 TaxID=1798551 RepID=A0A1G2BMC3_9BACT|nr:MAG: hypothetical protein A3B30_00520 [Candidatus Komeilibacteria bacterium RIFCSPLOWO2_01_FULL_52_15]
MSNAGRPFGTLGRGDKFIVNGRNHPRVHGQTHLPDGTAIVYIKEGSTVIGPTAHGHATQSDQTNAISISGAERASVPHDVDVTKIAI